MRQVGTVKASETEPLWTCRNALGDIKTRMCTRFWDESRRYLFTASVVSGMKRARARSGLLHGTGEPVVPGFLLAVSWWDEGSSPSGGNRKGQSTDLEHRGGPSRSSEEASVMDVEQRGQVIRGLVAGQPRDGRSQ